MNNLSKRRCEGMLLVSLIPFLTVACNEMDLSKLSPLNGQELTCTTLSTGCVGCYVPLESTHKCDTFEAQRRGSDYKCAVYHENAPIHLKCQETYEQECPYLHAC